MTDEYIVDRVLNGNTHLFSEIVSRYKDKVFRAAYRFTGDYNEAQDLSQEVFISVYKNLRKFKQNSSFSTWLYRVNYNLCIDWCRKNKKKLKKIALIDENVELADEKTDLEEGFISKQRKEALRNAINELDEKYRTVLILFHYQGLSYEEISEVMKLPVKTVETRLYRARSMLRKNVSAYDGGGELYEVPPGSQFDGSVSGR